MPIYTPSGAPVPSTTWANRGDSSLLPLGTRRLITDIGPSPGTMFMSGATRFVATGQSNANSLYTSSAPTKFLLIGGTGGTYTQTGTLVTVTWTSHGITDDQNGATTHLTIATGLAATGEYTNFTYVSADQFTVVSTVSQTTSGNLAANIAETFISFQPVVPSGLIDMFGDVLAPIGQALSKATAGTKTWRTYFGGTLLTANTTQTSAGQVTNVAPASLTMLSATKFQQTTSANVSVSRGDNTLKFSMQLPVGTDWMIYVPIRVSYGQLR